MSDNKLTISVALEAIDKMTAPVRRILGVTSSLEDQLAATRRQLRDLNTTSKDISGFDKLQIRITKTNADLTIAQAAYDKLSAKIKESGKASEAELAQLTKKQLRLQELQDKQRKYSQALTETKQRLIESGISTDKLADEQASLKTRIEQTTASLDRQNAAMAKSATHQKQLKQVQAARDQMHQRAQAMTVSGAGAMYSARGVIQNTVMPVASAAIDDEAAFASVKKVVDFKDAAAAQAFRREIQQMSMEMPVAATGLYEIAAAGGQLGVAQKDLKPFVKTTATMATAFDMTADRAGDMAAKIANIYQIPIQQMSDVGDAVNHLSNNTAAKANEMLDVLARTGGISKQFGLTAIQTSALADAMLALGKPPEVAATGINALLNKMQTATIQAKPFQKGLAKIGLSAEELERKVHKNGQAALLEFLKTLEKLPKERQMNVIGQLFGQEYADDISALVGGLKEYEKALGMVGDASKYAGSMQKEFEAKSATTQAGLKRLENQTTALKVEMGSALLPVINQLLQEVRPLIESTMKWARENPELVKTLMLASVAIAGVVAAGGALTMAMASVLGPIAMVRYGMGLFNLSSAGSAVAASRLGRVLSFGLNPLKLWRLQFSLMRGGISGTTSALLRLVGAGGRVAGRLLAMVPGFAKIRGGAAIAATAVKFLWRIFAMTPIGRVISLALLAYTAFKNWDTIWPAIKAGFAGMVSAISTRLKGWVAEVRQSPAKILEIFATLPIKLAQLGLDAINGFIKGMFDVDVAAAASRIANKVTGTVKDFLGIKSPSRVFMEIGGHTLAGMQIGLQQQAPALLQTVRQTAGILPAPFMAAANDSRFAMRNTLVEHVNHAKASAESRFSSPKVADMLAIKAQQNHSRSSRVDAPMNVQITIHATPGMDERAVADAVGRKLQQLERERERRMRGRLYDEAG